MLQKALTKAPVLAYPDPGQPFIMDTDTSNQGLGVVLSKEGEHGERVVAYYSCSLNSFCEPEGQLAQWLETLQGYNFKICHWAGRLHGNVDALSRQPCEETECRYCQHLEEWVTPVVAAVQEGDYPESSDEGQDTTAHTDPQQLREEQQSDAVLSQVHNWVTAGRCPEWSAVSALDKESKAYHSQFMNLSLIDGLLYCSWKAPRGGHDILQLLVPPRLRSQILQLIHGSVGAGHFGVAKMLRRLQSLFYWPNCHQDVCLSTGNCYVLVAMDYFTKWPEVYAVPDQSAATTAEKLVQEMFCQFGAPEEIHSDQGRNFESQVFQEVCRHMGVKKTRTTPLHPQSDGLVERFNCTLATQLAILSDRRQKDWDLHLPLVLWAY
ncbi:hypothetical protein LDENG_00246090 [Lucifuga dentata]|nr:hypothetical protein LDENG_00246090 [Lucifuga dentata]